MAIPKAMRFLAAATGAVFIFLFVQLYRREPAAIKLPDTIPNTKIKPGNRPQGWDHDPQLDGMLRLKRYETIRLTI